MPDVNDDSLIDYEHAHQRLLYDDRTVNDDGAPDDDDGAPDEHERIVYDIEHHADHLVVHPYCPDYLFDPVHHFIAVRPPDWDGA